jgi:hypothetical protein
MRHAMTQTEERRRERSVTSEYVGCLALCGTMRSAAVRQCNIAVCAPCNAFPRSIMQSEVAAGAEMLSLGVEHLNPVCVDSAYPCQALRR